MSASRLAAFVEPGRSLQQAVDRVRLAEDLGYESVWVTHIARREPLQVLSHYAHATERVRLGTAVVPIGLRHPALAAMEAATLDEIAGGRLVLGLGVSHKLTMEAWYGLPIDDPVGRMREYTAIVRQTLSTGSAATEGRHYTSRFSFMGYSPRASLPIVWAAMGPRMLDAAAELADGIVLWMCSPGHIKRSIRPALDAALRRHGRDPAGFEVVAATPVALTENIDAGRNAFRRQAFPYLNLPFYRKEISATHPRAIEAFDERIAQGDTAGAMAALPDAFVDDYAGIGDEVAVRGKIAEYVSAGATLPGLGILPRHEGGASPEDVLRAAVMS